MLAFYTFQLLYKNVDGSEKYYVKVDVLLNIILIFALVCIFFFKLNFNGKNAKRFLF